MCKPKMKRIGSRSSGIGQNNWEWWVGDKFTSADGNTIQLQWLFESTSKPKRTMV
jgi:hypothetical protein